MSIQSSISGFAEEVLHTQARIPGNLHISLHLWFWDWCLHDTVTNPSTEGTLGATPELKACTCQRQHEGKHLCCGQNVFNLQHKFIGSLSAGDGGGEDRMAQGIGNESCSLSGLHYPSEWSSANSGSPDTVGNRCNMNQTLDPLPSLRQ